MGLKNYLDMMANNVEDESIREIDILGLGLL